MSFLARLKIGLSLLILACAAVHGLSGPAPDLLANCLDRNPDGEHGCQDLLADMKIEQFLITAYAAVFGGFLLLVVLPLSGTSRS
jgi:hypothetical protein